MKSRAQLHKGGDSAAHFDGAPFGSGEPAHQAQQRTLSGAVFADNSHVLSVRYVEGDIFQGIEITFRIASKPIAEVLADEFGTRVPLKYLRDLLELNSPHD